MARTHTIDLLEEARGLSEEGVSEIEQAQDDLVERLEEEYESFAEVPQKYRDAYEEFDGERIETRGRAVALARQVLEWDTPGGDAAEHQAMEGHGSVGDLLDSGLDPSAAPSEVTVSDLTTGQLASIQDRVASESFDFDVETGEAEGTPKSGYGMVETLREAIRSQPQGAPSSERGEPEPAEYDHQVGMFLYERVNSLSTTGDHDLGNSSLRERMS